MANDPNTLRIATYNIEWFDTLFDDDGTLTPTQDWSARHNITKAQQIHAIQTVLRHIDADGILIVEAPDISPTRNGIAALEHFAITSGLRAHRAIGGFANDTRQELIFLYDPTRITARHDPQGARAMDGVMGDAPRFDKVFAADLDLDASQDRAVFSKPPLELALNTPLGALRLIGAHVKSKAPHGARTKTEATRISIDNRRKQLAQAVWLRNLADHHLRMAQPVIVLGDLNDGPGLDDYEKLFGQSSVEIIMGLNGPPARRLYDPHAYMALGRNAYPPNTARFYIPSQNRHLSALLDYIMVSPALRPLARQWRIWHPFENRAIARDPALRAALLVASDHFPVTLDLTR